MSSAPKIDYAKHGNITVKIIHSACHYITSHNACTHASHAPIFAVTLTTVRFLLRKRNNGIFHVIPFYVLWAYFFSPLKMFILNGCWFCKLKIHANRFRRGLGHGIQAGKTIILLWDLAHPRGPICHRELGIYCLTSSIHKRLWSSCKSNCLNFYSLFSIIYHSLLICARHGSKWNCFSSSLSIQVVMCCKWQTCCCRTHRLVRSVVHPSWASCIWCLWAPQHRSS